VRVEDNTLVDPARPASRAALAKHVGVGEATLRSWKAKGFVPDNDGLVTLAGLYAFCRAHPSLPAARAILDRMPAQSDSIRDSPDGIPAGTIDGADAETARAIARACRTATLDTFDALLRAAKTAEDAARGHRETLERLRHAFAAADDALVHLTAPSTLND
jgi:hypothetical protein